MNSYDVIEEAVKGYWKDKYPQDVVAFFQQKYSWDDEWERCEELVECHGSDDYENMTFLYDFCEGQTEVKDVIIVPLSEVTAFYSLRRIKPTTNYDRIVSKTPEELAVFASDLGCHPSASPKTCRGVGHCSECWLDWLKQEAEGGTQ